MKTRLLFLLLLSASTCLAQYEARQITDDTVFTGTTTTDSVAVSRKAHGNVGATETFDLNDGQFHTATLDQNCTVTLTGWAASGYSSSMTLRIINNGGFNFTWPGSVVSAPQINPIASSVTFIELTTSDGGTTVYSHSDYGSGVITITSKSAAYTTTLADANTAIYHPSSDNNARTFTIDSNANVAYPVGTTLTFINEINSITIAITSDTLTLQGANTTGSRTLAAGNTATAVKVTSTKWIITGSAGLTYWISPEMIWVIAA